MRTSDNFYEEFDQISPEQRQSQSFLIQSQGIYRRSEFLRLKLFKVPESISCDIFHDIDEGIGKDLFNFMTKLLVDRGIITNDGILERILSFDYGKLDVDHRPSNLKHLSGIQMRNLLLRFNFIFYGLEDYLFYEASSIMSKIIQIVHSNVVYSKHIDWLQILITRFKTIWHSEWKQVIKPKLHFMDHYPDLIAKIGPLALSDTTAFERHHRLLTRVVEKNPQFKNILKSLSVRHQTAWANSWKKSEFHVLDTGKGRMTKVDMNNVIQFPTNIDWKEEVYEVTKATFIYQYQKDLFVMSNEKKFCKIETVFIVEPKKIFLKCKEIESKYVSFFAAHEIMSESPQMTIIDVSQLKNKETFSQIQPYEKDVRFILCKRNII